jgi:AraC family transcriptional activator of pobA
MLAAIWSQEGLPLFHLYGDPPDDQAFDFIHIETIASRSVLNGWTIQPHRHRNLFQILLIEQGGGEMMHDAATTAFSAPAVILVAPTVPHAFRFQPELTNGWIVSFTEDAAQPFGDRSWFALSKLIALSADPIAAREDDIAIKRLSMLCNDLCQERCLAGEGYRFAMRGLLALIAIEVIRLAANASRLNVVVPASSDATVKALQRLLEEHFHHERHVAFYAGKLAMTPDRLNDHIKRATGVTAGRMIRQRVLTEAKRRLVFTNQSIQIIAYSLSFSDLPHFIRFFRKNTGTTPQVFRDERNS